MQDKWSLLKSRKGLAEWLFLRQIRSGCQRLR